MELTSTVRFNIKDPDEICRLITELGLGTDEYRKYFECAEYATLELTFNQDLKVVGGRVVPVGGR